MKKILFKKSTTDGAIEAEGIPYKTRNGIDVALHREGNSWYATELTSGKLATRRNDNLTLKAVKAEVEANSSVIMKILNKSQKSGKPERAAKKAKVKPPKKQKEVKLAAERTPRPNPFSGADDIYVTKNKIAVTKTQNTRAKRSFKKTTQTKYYEQNDGNLRLLKQATGDTVRVGRTGNKYKRLG